MRNINEVIDLILPLIPADNSLRQRFEWLKKDSSFKAPEQMGQQWAMGGNMLGESFQCAPTELAIEWQKAVYRIWMNLNSPNHQ